MLSHGVSPLGLLCSTMVPVHKDKRGSKSDSNNYRAIAISSILGKLFDSIIKDSRIQGFKSIYLQQPIHFATVLINKTYSTITRQIEITNNH